jgi:hypothetical protein
MKRQTASLPKAGPFTQNCDPNRPLWTRYRRDAQYDMETPLLRARFVAPGIDPARLRVLQSEHLDLPSPDGLPLVRLDHGH